MKLFNLSPLTQKRLERFRRSRVAFCSLCLLVGIFCISLCSELIANSKPLVMRYNGELTFPFLQSQPTEAVRQAVNPEDPNSVTTVNYRKFAKTHLKKEQGDFAWFTMVPYSPDETLDKSELEDDKVVTVTLLPEQPIGRFNLTAEGKIVRQDGCGQFFPGIDLRDEKTAMATLIAMDDTLKAEIEKRLRGEACEAVELDITPAQAFPWKTLKLSLPPVTAERKPATLRVNIYAPSDEEGVAPFYEKLSFKYKYALTDDGDFVTLDNGERADPVLQEKGSSALPSAEAKAQIDAWGKMGFERDITTYSRISATFNNIRYNVTSGNNIRFPFPPTGNHIFGLDASGRDVFARILYATRIALLFGLTLAITATLLGMFIGAMQGYFAGKVDICIQRATELWATLPFLYVMVLMGQVFGKSFTLLLICYGLFCWIGLSYYMRAEFLRLRNRPFVAAARCQGLSNARIIFRHILPNALTPMITLFPFLLVGAIGSLVSLDFLGFGLPPMTPSWGELLNQAQANREAWWLILFPTMAIFAVMFLTVMVGEGVRNAFDPKPFSKLQ